MAEERRPSPNTLFVIYIILGLAFAVLILFSPDLVQAILLLSLGILSFISGWITQAKILPGYSIRHEQRRDTILYYFQPKDPPRLGQWGRFKGKPEEDWNFRMKAAAISYYVVGVFLLIFSVLAFLRAF